MSRASARAGFTLAEMMAVMLVVAMVASLAIASTPGSGRPVLKAVAMEAAALLRREREGAMLAGGDRAVALMRARRVLVGTSGGEVAIPRDVAVDVLGAGDLESGDIRVALFHPDGSSSGAVLRFSREKAEYEIRVNWYAGAISVNTP